MTLIERPEDIDATLRMHQRAVEFHAKRADRLERMPRQVYEVLVTDPERLQRLGPMIAQALRGSAVERD